VPDELSGELKAMAQVESALVALQEEERSRVLRWASSRFDVELYTGKSRTKEDSGQGSGADEGNQPDFPDFATLYDSARPETDAEKALVAAHWVQVKEGASEVEAQTVNTMLKNMGHGVGNITRAFESLKDQRPSLIMQTKKEGSAKQARKKFRVTTAGIRAVEEMLRRV
jgi:hypothetical protein